MGTVYEAWEPSLQRRVALKVLAAHVSAVPTSVQRFHREAQAAAKLHHMHIVPIFAQGEEDGVYYYAMELIDGPSLHAIIGEARDEFVGGTTTLDADETVALQRPGFSGEGSAAATQIQTSAGDSTVPLSPSSQTACTPEHFQMVARHIASVADALDYAHEHGVVHRDVKPHNLLMGGDGRLRVSDFGLARIAEQPGVTMTGEVIGSPLYMSPEQILGGPSKVDHRTDIYSLGATMYEWLTLQPPYPGETREQVIRMIAGSEPSPLRAINAKVPVDLETICMKAIARDRSRRYQTAAEFRDDLRRFLDHRPIKAKRTALTTRFGKYIGRHQVASLGLVAVIVAMSLGVALRAKQSEVRTQLAAVEEAQQDKEHILDLLSSLPPEIGGSLRFAGAAVEDLVQTGQRLAADESQGANEARAGTVPGIAGRALYDLYDALGVEPWPDTDGPGPCAPAVLGSVTPRSADLEEGLRLVDQCLSVQPDHFAARQLHLAIVGSGGQYAVMMQEAYDLARRRPDDPRGHLWLGLAQLILLHGDKTLETLAGVSGSEATAPWVQTVQALALLALEQPTSAIALFTEVSSAAPDLMVAMLGRAAAHAAAGNLRKSVDDLSVVIEAEPRNADALALRGDHRMLLGDFELADDDYNQAMEIAGKTPTMIGRYFSAVLAQRNAAQADDEEAGETEEADQPLGESGPAANSTADHPIQGWFSRYVWPRMPDQRNKDSTSPSL